MSNGSSSTLGSSSIVDRTKRAPGKPSSTASRPARSIAAGLKSAPVTRAPSRAHDSVSIPKWHWRWSRLWSTTGPMSSSSYGRIRTPPFRNPSRS